MFSFYWCLYFSFLVFEIHHWLWCWCLCIHHWSLWHPWLASTPTNKRHTRGCRCLWTCWRCDCSTSPLWFEDPFWCENGNQRILQESRYNHSLPCISGKHPLCLLKFWQLRLMLCAYFCVNSCDDCITPSHRTWWTLCEPCQNTRNCTRSYENMLFMWTLSSNTLGNYGNYLACHPFRKGD